MELTRVAPAVTFMMTLPGWSNDMTTVDTDQIDALRRATQRFLADLEALGDDASPGERYLSDRRNVAGLPDSADMVMTEQQSRPVIDSGARDVAEWLRSTMARHRLGPADLADWMGLTRQWLSKITNGHTKLPASQLAQIILVMCEAVHGLVFEDMWAEAGQAARREAEAAMAKHL